MSIPSATVPYTIDNVCWDCVGRYIVSPKSGAVDASQLISGRTYARCWEGLCNWLLATLLHARSPSVVNLTPVGVLFPPEAATPASAAAASAAVSSPPSRGSFQFLPSFLAHFRLEAVQPDEQVFQGGVPP